MTEKPNLRDYGFGDHPTVEGSPTIKDRIDNACPNCGCRPVFGVEVVVKDPPAQLRVPEGHQAVGTYVGCAACPWASPMMTWPNPSPIEISVKMAYQFCEAGDSRPHGM